MNILMRIINILAVPIALINLLGGIISGIWLAIIGEWSAIGYGILALFISGFGLAIAFIPSTLLSVPGVYFAEKGHKIPLYIFSFISNLYIIAVLSIWCGAVLFFFAQRAHTNSIIPLMIWSYGVATGPLIWMAQKEQQEGDGIGSLIATFFAQIGYIAMILMVLILRASLREILFTFIIIMLVGLMLQFKVFLETDRALKEHEEYDLNSTFDSAISSSFNRNAYETEMLKCPYCAEENEVGTIICEHCGELIEGE